MNLTVKTENQTLKETCDIIAPVMYGFVEWILRTAEQRGIKTVYFLARDGYLMKQIAEKINSSVKLGYIYCSRASLRLAALNCMSLDEAFDLFLMSGVSVTPKSVLDRLYLTDNQRYEIYADIGFDSNENAQLSKAELQSYTDKLRKSSKYISLLKAIGEQRYMNCTAYLEQTIDFSESFAIADSGWVGSVQHTFSQLFASMGKTKPLIGFYFGLYNNPSDGEYLTYAFSKKSALFSSAKFSNHLFEAICSAPYGMTTDYEIKNGKAYPVLADEQNLNADNEICKPMQEYILKFAENPHWVDKKDCLKKLYKLMYEPKKEQAELFGSFLFSDDISEERYFPLAEKITSEQLKSLILPIRLYRKMIHANTLQKPIFWPYGAISITDRHKSFYRMNAYLWEILWLIKKK